MGTTADDDTDIQRQSPRMAPQPMGADEVRDRRPSTCRRGPDPSPEHATMNELVGKLKNPSGWFAAGRKVSRALVLLSDGAFKLYIHLCLKAGRSTGLL